MSIQQFFLSNTGKTVGLFLIIICLLIIAALIAYLNRQQQIFRQQQDKERLLLKLQKDEERRRCLETVKGNSTRFIELSSLSKQVSFVNVNSELFFIIPAQQNVNTILLILSNTCLIISTKYRS